MSDRPPPYQPLKNDPPSQSQEDYPSQQKEGYLAQSRESYPSHHPAQYTATATANVSVVPPGTVLAPASFEDEPLPYQCPNCGNVITTTVRSKTTTIFIIALVLVSIAAILGHLVIGIFAFGFILFLLIPPFKTYEHTCPIDGQVLGTYTKKWKLKLF